jgi:hypothetical protein
MRKYFLSIFGILCFILFGQAGFIQAQQSYSQRSEVNSSTCFESGNADQIWGIEKTETTCFGSTDNQISPQKKRGQDSFSRFFISADWFSTPASFILQKNESCINLFLIYQFSHSLWGAFLQ